MAERDRLRDLQVGEARHDRVGVLLGQVDEARGAAPRAAPRCASIAPRSHSRTSVATWSLRERPVCRRLPASPTSAVSRFSMLRCTSSRSSDQANVPAAISSRIVARPRSMSARSCGAQDARTRRACGRGRANRRCPPAASRWSKSDRRRVALDDVRRPARRSGRTSRLPGAAGGASGGAGGLRVGHRGVATLLAREARRVGNGAEVPRADSVRRVAAGRRPRVRPATAARSRTGMMLACRHRICGRL